MVGKICNKLLYKYVWANILVDSFQITTLVNAKERPAKSEKTLNALARVGQAVNLAVERFVNVGEAIAQENEDFKEDMCQACSEARQAGELMSFVVYVGIEHRET